jgi:CDP-diacylglycerol--serine O-phosphatidyltransferase
MTSDNHQQNRHRGIYLLPNLFTTAALFSGFFGIVAAIHGRYEQAAVAIFIAMILDNLDGRIARLTNTSSDFGAEYDSLADMVSFGIAPALIMYQWALAGMANLGWVPAKLGWLAAFVYAAATALRLARFNTQLGSTDKRFFVGLPSPMAAAIMVGLVWVGDDLGFSGNRLIWLAFIITVGSGLLMVSNILYFSFKEFDVKGRVPFMTVLIIVLIFVFTSIDPPKVLFTAALCYGLSGPALALWRRRQRARRRSSSS